MMTRRAFLASVVAVPLSVAVAARIVQGVSEKARLLRDELREGDVFTINGVYKYKFNPVTRQPTTRLMKFRVWGGTRPNRVEFVRV